MGTNPNLIVRDKNFLNGIFEGEEKKGLISDIIDNWDSIKEKSKEGIVWPKMKKHWRTGAYRYTKDQREKCKKFGDDNKEVLLKLKDMENMLFDKICELKKEANNCASRDEVHEIKNKIYGLVIMYYRYSKIRHDYIQAMAMHNNYFEPPEKDESYQEDVVLTHRREMLLGYRGNETDVIPRYQQRCLYSRLSMLESAKYLNDDKSPLLLGYNNSSNLNLGSKDKIYIVRLFIQKCKDLKASVDYAEEFLELNRFEEGNMQKSLYSSKGEEEKKESYENHRIINNSLGTKEKRNAARKKINENFEIALSMAINLYKESSTEKEKLYAVNVAMDAMKGLGYKVDTTRMNPDDYSTQNNKELFKQLFISEADPQSQKPKVLNELKKDPNKILTIQLQMAISRNKGIFSFMYNKNDNKHVLTKNLKRNGVNITYDKDNSNSVDNHLIDDLLSGKVTVGQVKDKDNLKVLKVNKAIEIYKKESNSLTSKFKRLFSKSWGEEHSNNLKTKFENEVKQALGKEQEYKEGFVDDILEREVNFTNLIEIRQSCEKANEDSSPVYKGDDSAGQEKLSGEQRNELVGGRASANMQFSSGPEKAASETTEVKPATPDVSGPEDGGAKQQPKGPGKSKL